MSAILEDDLKLEEDTQKGKFLTFALGAEVFGIEIKYVTEIIGMQSITEVPELPAYVRGIINLRGKIIPVIDIRLRFKKPLQKYNDRTCIIVVDIKEITVGMIVDTVAEVVNIAEENLVAPPQMNSHFQQRYLKAIGKVDKEIKLILDCDRLLTDDETAELEAV